VNQATCAVIGVGVGDGARAASITPSGHRIRLHDLHDRRLAEICERHGIAAIDSVCMYRGILLLRAQGLFRSRELVEQRA
jgi:hypothetical protein